MLKRENNFDFRNKILEKYPERIRDVSVLPEPDEYELQSGMQISYEENADETLRLAAEEFIGYLAASVNVAAETVHEAGKDGCISIRIDPSYGGYKQYRIETGDGIRITSHDGRGAVQALYRLENIMTFRRAPYIKKGMTEHAPLFSPRITHSGWAMGEFPDAHLRQIAHAGMDAVTVSWNGDRDNFAGINQLVSRAVRYGIDVYVYSGAASALHPDDTGAADYYDRLYGDLFEECPGVKGVILVGESVAFPTRDPNSTPYRYHNNLHDGIPYDRPSADVWPCIDYAAWADMVKRSIHRHKPDADIVFWTYNFGYAPEPDRLRLINALPAGISLLVTFEMFEKYVLGGTVGRCSDYTLSFAGPGKYFISEAEAAKSRGIRLYAMSNTGGRTWDIGVIPYEPMPQQWIKRYSALRDAREKWGLSGLVDSHHYGFWPSFVGDLARLAFETPFDDESALDYILSGYFGAGNVPEVKDALDGWSTAITMYTPTNEDQYGAFRVGPAYPLNLVYPAKIPASENAAPDGFYTAYYSLDNNGGKSLTGIRIGEEIRSLESMLCLLKRGNEILHRIKNKNYELERLINLGEFIECCVVTGINAKKWFVTKSKLNIESSAESALTLCGEAEAIIKNELANAERAIPLVRADSRLGYEPVMGYVCSERQLLWKIEQLRFVRDSELRAYRAGLMNGDPYERLFLPCHVRMP